MNAKISIIVGVLALAGCRNPGLPPEPPEQDPANSEAAATGSAEAGVPPDPFTRSAFEGVKLDGGGHHHHHHGHGKAKAGHGEPEPEPEPEPAKATPTAEDAPSQAVDHTGHGQGGRS